MCLFSFPSTIYWRGCLVFNIYFWLLSQKLLAIPVLVYFWVFYSIGLLLTLHPAAITIMSPCWNKVNFTHWSKFGGTSLKVVIYYYLIAYFYLDVPYCIKINILKVKQYSSLQNISLLTYIFPSIHDHRLKSTCWLFVLWWAHWSIFLIMFLGLASVGLTSSWSEQLRKCFNWSHIKWAAYDWMASLA
jgi:hypothetical protein